MHDIQYTAAINAWYATMLERDKSVLTLASAGIAGTVAGFITLAASTALGTAYWMCPGVIASIFFLASFWLSLNIFRDNADYLSDMLPREGDNHATKNDRLKAKSANLRRRKNQATNSLIAGVTFALGMGAVATLERVATDREAKIAQQKGNTMANQGRSDQELIQRILNGSRNGDSRFNKFEDAHNLAAPMSSEPTRPGVTQQVTVGSGQSPASTPSPAEPKASAPSPAPTDAKQSQKP